MLDFLRACVLVVRMAKTGAQQLELAVFCMAQIILLPVLAENIFICAYFRIIYVSAMPLVFFVQYIASLACSLPRGYNTFFVLN